MIDPSQFTVLDQPASTAIPKPIDANAGPPIAAIVISVLVLLAVLAVCGLLARLLIKRMGMQKFIVLCGGGAFVLCGLFPPWLLVSQQGHAQAWGYSFILSPPEDYRGYGYKLDACRLLVEWICILAASGTVWILVAKKNGYRETPDGLKASPKV